jgi:hypothetical protein
VLPLLEDFRRSAAEGDPAAESGAAARGAPAQEEGAAATGPLQPYFLAELPSAGEPEDFEDADREIYLRLVSLVQVEAPIHRDEAARRLAACWGITRLSRAVEARVAAALSEAEKQGRLLVKGEFLWLPGDESPVPRSRQGEGVPRESELIALEEIAAVATLILDREFRLHRDDLVTRVARLLGYRRTGNRLRRRIQEAIELGLARGRIEDTEHGMRLKGS